MQSDMASKMTLIDAINEAASGATIVSNSGRHYTPEMLAPIWSGNERCVAFTTAGMTEGERKGAWTAIA